MKYRNAILPFIFLAVLTVSSAEAVCPHVCNDTTDRWVSLPFEARWNPFGLPLNHELLWSDLKVTDGIRAYGLAEAKELEWVVSRAPWWNPGNQGWRTIGIPGDLGYQTTIAQPWHGYHMYAAKPVALIVPATTNPSDPRGSVLATVTDGTNPLVNARVYCKYGSALTDSNGTAQIGELPAGTYLVTACAQGYRSQSKSGTVGGDTVQFALESRAGAIVWLTADPTRIAPNGTSTSAITVHAVDLEGAPLVGKSVNMTTDLSVFQQSGSDTVSGSTNDQGIFTASLVSLTTPNTATVTATCEGMNTHCYVEFAADGVPTARIQSPTAGASVTRGMTLSITASDTGGSQVAVEKVCVEIDGTRWGIAHSDEANELYEVSMNTVRLSNGSHTLQATVYDIEGNIGYSQKVIIDVHNVVADLTMTPPEIFIDDPEPFVLNGLYSGEVGWRVELADQAGTEIASSSGSGNEISFQWDGKLNGEYVQGIYWLSIQEDTGQLLGQGIPEIGFPLSVSRLYAQVLIAGKTDETNQSWSSEASFIEMAAVKNACESWGLTCTLVENPIWVSNIDPKYTSYPRLGLREMLKDGGYSVFFLTTHGGWGTTDFGAPYVVTWFECGDGPVYSLRSLPNLPDSFRNEPTNNFVSDCNLENSGQYKVVMINACWSAFLGDMSTAFGMNSASNHMQMDQTYMGWQMRYVPLDWPWYGSEFTNNLWGYMAQGGTVLQAYGYAMQRQGWMMGSFMAAGGYPETTWLPW